MSDLGDLREVCRCCHSSGVFKSVLDQFTYEGNVEVYSDLIRDVLGIQIQIPPFAASHTICEQCIMQLRFCHKFKQQVLECEKKFLEYCKNELLISGSVKAEVDGTGAKQTSTAKLKPEKIVRTLFYSCEFCNHRFNKKQELREHEIKKHYNAALSCKTCELTFKNHVIRAMHMKKHNSTGNGLRCKHCDKYYGTEKALIEHIDSHFRDNVYQCEICPKKFPYKHTLRRHVEWHKQKFTESHVRLQKCKICSMAFRKSSEVRTHMLRRHKLHFMEQQRLKLTRKNQARLQIIRCTECDKTFTRADTMKRHIDVVHKGSMRRYVCNLCTANFTSSGALSRHRKNKHGNNKKEKCEICNKLCTHLKEHKKVHIKAFKCEQCFKPFAAQNSLNRHIRFVHMGVRPFSCDQCNKTFGRADHYRRHLRKAHGIDKVKVESNTDRFENISDGINEMIGRLNTTN